MPQSSPSLSTISAQISALQTALSGQIAGVASKAAQTDADILAQRTALLDPANGAIPLLAGQVGKLSDQVAALGTVTPPSGDGSGTTGTPPPPDTNVYPLTMQPVANRGDPVTLGVGPDTITVDCGSDPGTGDCNLALLLDGKAIAGPLLVTGNFTKAQTFTLHGSWGAPPHTLQFVSAGGPVGLGNLIVRSMTLNFVPFGVSGPSLDARDQTPLCGALAVWDNIGASFVAKVPADVPAPPPPPPAPVGDATIVGAQINSIPHATDTLANLVAATPTGGTLLLPAGTFSGAAPIGTICTIKGAGMGQTIIDSTGLALPFGKGTLVPTVAVSDPAAGVQFEDMTLRGAACGDNNGAGIREGGPGVAYSATRVEFTGNQDGILTFASDKVLNNCLFHDNGAGGSQSHEMYINGDPSTVVTLNNVSSTCGTKSTHALKSRAGTTNVSGGTYAGNPDDGAVGGSVMDFPNGGNVVIDRAHLILRAAATGNTIFISYGFENATNGTDGTLTLTNVHLSDQSTDKKGGTIARGAPVTGARLVIGANCTYDGPTPPQFQGWADGAITGAFMQAS